MSGYYSYFGDIADIVPPPAITRKIAGRGVARFIPYVGWVILAYEAYQLYQRFNQPQPDFQVHRNPGWIKILSCPRSEEYGPHIGTSQNCALGAGNRLVGVQSPALTMNGTGLTYLGVVGRALMYSEVNPTGNPLVENLTTASTYWKPNTYVPRFLGFQPTPDIRFPQVYPLLWVEPNFPQWEWPDPDWDYPPEPSPQVRPRTPIVIAPIRDPITDPSTLPWNWPQPPPIIEIVIEVPIRQPVVTPVRTTVRTPAIDAPVRVPTWTPVRFPNIKPQTGTDPLPTLPPGYGGKPPLPHPPDPYTHERKFRKYGGALSFFDGLSETAEVVDCLYGAMPTIRTAATARGVFSEKMKQFWKDYAAAKGAGKLLSPQQRAAFLQANKPKYNKAWDDPLKKVFGERKEFDKLPEQYSLENADVKLQWIYDNYEELDAEGVNSFLSCVIYNQFAEDKVIGSLMGAKGDAVKGNITKRLFSRR